MDETRSAARFARFGPDQSGVSLTVAGEPGGGPPLMVEPVWRKVWRGRWMVGCTAAVFALLAMMLGGLKQPLYRTQTSIEVESPQRLEVPAADDAAAARESFVETQIRIIESRWLVDRVLGKLSEADRARLLDEPHFWWTRTNEKAAAGIQRHIVAKAAGKPGAKAGLIDISFLAADGTAGAHFLNILVQELADYNVERTWRMVQQNRRWTERQIDELRRKWEQSEQVLAEYQQVSGTAVAVKRVSLPGGQDVNEPKARQLRARLAELNQEIGQWEALYGPAGAAVVKLKAEAAQTESALRQQRRVSVAAIPAALPELPHETFPDARQKPAPSSARLAALQQEAASNKAIYEATAGRLKEASVVMASDFGTISVVDPAVASSSLATPGQLLTGTLGAVMGLLAGAGFVALRERFSSTFSEPAVLGQYLGIPVLGAIPVDRFGEDGKSYDEVNQEPALHLNFETDLQTAEAFRSIRSSILFGAKAGPKKLMFAGAGASESSAFVIGNLGAALATAQRRVLLVDGNLRNPGLHKIFGARNDRGLVDLLSREISEEPIGSRDVIQETQIPDLYLLPAGHAGARGPEILSSVQLPALMREFAKGFDLVLVDSAPALPYADARGLARAVDGVVLVVRAGSTQRQKAMEAREAIRQDGSAIIGAILTEWDSATSASA